MTTLQLKAEFDSLNQATVKSLDSIRDRVDEKLIAITDQVQRKLDENIKEGFAQFEKVQQHLKAAEEQLREVGALGHSINDLNNMLKLPHLRGQFGEAEPRAVALGFSSGAHVGVAGFAWRRWRARGRDHLFSRSKTSYRRKVSA